MTTPGQLRDLDSRPRRYWNVDGIPELLMGLVWILWGAAFLVGEAIPRGPAARIYWMIFPAVLVLSGFGATWLVRRLKARFTYPRTGYLEYREPGTLARALTALLIVLSAAALAALIVTGRAAGAERSAAPAIGVILSLGFVVASVRQKAPHFLALAGVALALGAAAAALKLGWTGMNWVFVWLGTASALMGAWRLRRYLRKHPAEVEA
ncbi:MAG: hypothetical protein R6V57_01685 [Vicinamibacterales bacterium]